MRIGILEDEPALSQLLMSVLKDAGHSGQAFASCRALKVALRQDSFDLLLLDWNLPDGDGMSMLGWARQHLDPCPPVIMLTSRVGDGDVVSALEAGADDYVTKPMQAAVLLARLSALLRRTYKIASDHSRQEELHGVHFDHEHCSVTLPANEPVTLTAKEFGLTLALFRNLNRPLSRTYLLEAVWGRNPDLPTRTLDVHVSRLRSRLGLRPDHGFRLMPVHSFGYRLEQVDLQGVQQVA